MDIPGPTNVVEMPPGLPFEQKWEFLRPHIEQLYIHENCKLPDVIKTLKGRFGFDATEAQYKYQINKKWHLRKNIPTSKKAAMNQRYQHLSTTGTSAVIKYKGQEVAPHKLRRQAKMETRTALMRVGANETRRGGIVFSGPLVSPAAKLLMTWNMPYKATRAFMSQNFDHNSPFGQLADTPSDVSVGTPYANAIASPSGPPSPLSSALQRQKSVERARMFLEGNYDQLIASMNSEEQVTMSTWMYQFWLFSFKTAKYWGQGPRDWIADILGFGRNGLKSFATFPTPSSPSTHSPHDGAGRSPPGPATAATQSKTAIVASVPSPFCRWAIHVHPNYEERLPDPPIVEHGAMDPADPGTYKEWPKAWTTPSYPERLRDALETNDFSSIPTDRLPAAIPEALQRAKRDPDDLVRESLGFAIMSRNCDMLDNMLGGLLQAGKKLEIEGFDMFHLATSYLDGSTACCAVVETLSYYCPLRQHYTNDLGHTVLDNLMIAILKGHSSCAPHKVDNAFKGQKRFPGEEVDICGRWDADSDCIRELLAKGIHHIPFQWKHKFCHTSIQAICHSITIFWGPESAPDINTCSGLFVRRCSQPHCGLKMQLSPLHVLLLVALQLSSHGCEGEDLFGIVAVLVFLLRYGADPSIQSSVDLNSLLGSNSQGCYDHEPEGCKHPALDPLQLANVIYSLKNMEWTERVQLGWRTCSEVLQYWQQIRALKKFGELLHSGEGGANVPNFCGDCLRHNGGVMAPEVSLRKNRRLGRLWSMINTELVTYRRLQVGHPWMSNNISLEGLLESLQNDCEPDLPLVKYNLMKPCCFHCGSFIGNTDFMDPNSACAFYFSNMEDWSRTTFLHLPDGGFPEWSIDFDRYSYELPESDQQMEDAEDLAISNEVPNNEGMYGIGETFYTEERQDDLDSQW